MQVGCLALSHRFSADCACGASTNCVPCVGGLFVVRFQMGSLVMKVLGEPNQARHVRCLSSKCFRFGVVFVTWCCHATLSHEVFSKLPYEPFVCLVWVEFSVVCESRFGSTCEMLLLAAVTVTWFGPAVVDASNALGGPFWAKSCSQIHVLYTLRRGDSCSRPCSASATGRVQLQHVVCLSVAPAAAVRAPAPVAEYSPSTSSVRMGRLFAQT